jgi:hypothetical protein
MEAFLGNGAAGYVLAPSARGHTKSTYVHERVARGSGNPMEHPTLRTVFIGLGLMMAGVLFMEWMSSEIASDKRDGVY